MYRYATGSPKEKEVAEAAAKLYMTARAAVEAAGHDGGSGSGGRLNRSPSKGSAGSLLGSSSVGGGSGGGEVGGTSDASGVKEAMAARMFLATRWG